MAKLHILSGVLEGKVFDLLEERITVGRGVDNIICLEDGTVSHHHAMLVQDGLEYTVRDLNSTNGSRVNGMRIVESKLNNGDKLRLGSIEMRYESSAKKSSQPLPATRTGVDLTQVDIGGEKPPTFTSTSPFGGKSGPKRNILLYVVLGLALVAASVLALLAVKFFSM